MELRLAYSCSLLITKISIKFQRKIIFLFTNPLIAYLLVLYIPLYLIDIYIKLFNAADVSLKTVLIKTTFSFVTNNSNLFYAFINNSNFYFDNYDFF